MSRRSKNPVLLPNEPISPERFPEPAPEKLNPVGAGAMSAGPMGVGALAVLTLELP